MSFLESLFLYNILEAIVIILFCNVISNNGFKINSVKDCIKIGVINLVIQYVNLLIPNPIFQLLYNLVVLLLIMPIVIFIYFHSSNKYNIIQCFSSCIFIFIINAILNDIFNSIFGMVFTNKFDDKYYEFICNIILRATQMLLIYLLYKGKCLIMKKLLKKIAAVSVEQAFTAMNEYQPKIPEKLVKELAEKQ